MAIQQKLQTKLAQKLILTPSLQQAIKLLPMSTLELADLLNQELFQYTAQVHHQKKVLDHRCVRTETVWGPSRGGVSWAGVTT